MKKLNSFTILLCALLLSSRILAVENSVVIHQQPFGECETIRIDIYDTLCCPADAQTKYPQLDIKQSGVYKDTVPSLVTGCDSITTYNIVLLAEDPTYKPLENAVICDGDSITWRGKKYRVEGMYFDTVRYSKSGCPGEIYSLDLKVNSVTPMHKDTAICQGDTIEWRGKKISTEDTYYDTARYVITNCDSIHYSLKVKVNVVLKPIVKDTFICDSNFVAWEWRGQSITKDDSTYCDTVRYIKSGCDSVVYVLNVKNAYTQLTTVYDTLLCNIKEAQAKYKQFIITEKGAYKDTLASKITGCDSVITYHINWLNANPISMPTQDTTICEGDVIEWRGKKLSEDSIYYDTIPYIATGCDSVIYSLRLKLYRPDRLSTTETICQGDSIEWRGKKFTKEGMYYDTIRAIITGCDSMIYSMDLKVNYVMQPIVKDTFICDGNFIKWTWRGLEITQSDSTYKDTVRYTLTGCDSVVYMLNVKSATTQTTEVIDTLCLLEAQAKYAQLQITGSGIYIDTIPSVVSGCDSIITYQIHIYENPAFPNLQNFNNFMPVICGDTLKPNQINKAVFEAAKNQPRENARFSEIWVEVSMETASSNFEKVKDQLVIANTDSIKFRLAGKSDCNPEETLYGGTIKRLVETPTPENTSKLDSMPAVKKYNNYLLMVHYNKITTDADKKYQLKEDDVTWYRVVGDVDPVLEIKDDEKVGVGYYYSVNQSLAGRYYAIMRDYSNDCSSILRSVVLECSMAQEMTLTPVSVRRGDKMTLSQIDPEEETQMAIYDMNGQLVKTMRTNGVETYPIQVNQSAGMYLLRAVNGDRESTFKFIVTQ